MNIKIVDSWLREYLDTKASVQTLAEKLSLTSVSVERLEKHGDDHIYDIEVTTNRPDLMSVIGLSLEASAILPEFDVAAKFKKPQLKTPNPKGNEKIEIQNDPKLVNRICAAVLEVKVGKSPKKIMQRLEASGIRSLNNLIDITNYVMRETGHPTHVFDYDRLVSKKIIIRESKPGETITTLDGKQYRLYGEDIIADDGAGQIIDLLGVMGTQNSVVTDSTKRILFFIDNNEPTHIRRTSMGLGIRTEAAILNEKDVDPQMAMDALLRGIEYYEKFAEGKLVSKLIDIYPNKPKEKSISVSLEKIEKVIGTNLELGHAKSILERLEFKVTVSQNELTAKAPSFRAEDVNTEEDLIEEIARVFGYHKLPSVIPSFTNNKIVSFANDFYFEERVKNALKYWGYTEVYSYSLISEELYQGPIEDAVKLKNPLTEDMVYLRNSLVPSLLQVEESNKKRENLKIFEIANTYHKRVKNLPVESLSLAGVLKSPKASFYEAKGTIETVLEDIGIKGLKFKNRKEGGVGADMYKDSTYLGYIELLNNNLIDFELDFGFLLKQANLKKNYKSTTKYPPVVEDLSVSINENISTEDIMYEIRKQSELIVDVNLIDSFQIKRTFHIVYQSDDKNLTGTEVKIIREKIIEALKQKFSAEIA